LSSGSRSISHSGFCTRLPLNVGSPQGRRRLKKRLGGGAVKAWREAPHADERLELPEIMNAPIRLCQS